MSRRTVLVQKLREHRKNREFERALQTASPAMRQELTAAATRQMNLL